MVTSCGDDVATNSLLIHPQNENKVQLPQHFRTRLNNNLLIAGTRCIGGETTINVDRETVTCERNQFLLTIDNVNSCDLSGCSDLIVDPIIAELQLPPEENDQFDFFEIIPISTVNDEQRRIIDEIRIRSNETGAEVVTTFP